MMAISGDYDPKPRLRKYANAKAGYDPACETLAEHFLRDDPIDDPLARGSLAAAIQGAVEDWYLHERTQAKSA